MNKETLTAVVSTILDVLLSDEEENEFVTNVLLATKDSKKRKCIKHYVYNLALNYNLDDFKSHLRLQRDTFEFMPTILGPHLHTKSTPSGAGRPTEPVEKQFLIALSMLCNQEVFRITSERYDIAKSTAWSYTHKVCKALVHVSGEYIKWSMGVEATKTMALFHEKQGFPKVMGAIDGTHIAITLPLAQQASYCNQNKYHSIILQGVCDAEYKFIDVFAGYARSVHDARVFRNSDLGKKLEDDPNQLLPNNSHILADSAYRNTESVLTPHRDNGHLTRAQKLYNYKHSSTRACIEQSFGLLKGRFRILKHVNIYSTKLIPPVIVACCVLHNLCMKKADVDVEPHVENDHANLSTCYMDHDATVIM